MCTTDTPAGRYVRYALGFANLYDEAVKLAHRAAEDGVDTTLAVGDDMHHIWPVMSSFLPEAKESLAQIGEFVRKHTE
jgi:acetyl esterase/lipase